MLRKIFVSICLLFTIPLAVYGSDLEEKIAAASAAFDEGEYAKSLAVYQKIIDDGHTNGHIYYNMGVAYHRLQKTGEAMAAFLAARHYLPRDPDVAFNLQFIQDKITDNLSSVMPRKFYDVIRPVIDYLTQKEITVTAFILVVAAFLLLTFYLFHRQIAFLLKLGVLILILAVLSIVFLQAKTIFTDHWGAIVSESTKVYSGPNDSNTTLFILHEGAPFVVEKKTNGYLKIKLSDGKKGWVAASSARSFSFSPQKQG